MTFVLAAAWSTVGVAAPPTVASATVSSLEVLPDPSSPEAFQRVVEADVPDLAACYERALDATPRLQGYLVLRVDVARDGSVSNVSGNPSPITDEGLIDCVTGRLEILRFTRPSGAEPVRLVVTLEFEETAVGESGSGPHLVLWGGGERAGVAIGGLIGERGTQLGAGGLGSRGSGIGSLGVSPASEPTASGQPRGGLGRVGGDPIILGAMDRSAIDAVIDKQRSTITSCYRTRAKERPELAGRVVAKFIVAENGEVAEANVKTSTLDDDAVEQCIIEAIRGARFPKPGGGGIVIVSYPFSFPPSD